MVSSLLTLSPWVLILGVAISAISVAEAVATKKTGRERAFKSLTAILAILLLCIQAASNKRSAADSQVSLKQALTDQKQQVTSDLTSAFSTGTNQIIKLAGQEADKTRKAAEGQTKAIQSQAHQQEMKLEDASLGSDHCPKLESYHWGHQKPFALSVFNFDKGANIYDLVVYVQENRPCAW